MGNSATNAALANFSKDQQEILKRLPVQDRNLQILLRLHGFGFVLKEHQFRAARFVAGVPDDWPMKLPSTSTVRGWPVLQPGGGGILGDEMGLGKTVELLAGAVLREIIAKQVGDADEQQRSNSRSFDRNNIAHSLSTLVVTPNWSVATQWKAHALLAGFGELEIIFYTWYKSKPARGFPRLVLTTIHVLMADMRASFNSIHKSTADCLSYVPPPLSPQLSALCSAVMHAKYHGDSGSKPSKLWVKAEKAGMGLNECIIQDAGSYVKGSAQLSWMTAIIDEAHFLRNPLTLWSLQALAIGQHSKRMILATGTPYNNRLDDMASLCSFYEPRCSQANPKWWKMVFGELPSPPGSDMAREIQEWKSQHLFRRTREILCDQLPARHRKIVNVKPSLSEFEGIEGCSYLQTEAQLLNTMKRFASLLRGAEPSCPREKFARKRKLDALSKQMLGLMQKVRMFMLHPLLGCGGRELTCQFSPSRCRQSLKPVKACVVCNPTLSMVTAPLNVRDPGLDGSVSVDSDSDGAGDDSSEPIENSNVGHANSQDSHGRLIQLPPSSCGLRERHWVHEQCQGAAHLECPRCKICRHMLHIGADAAETGGSKMICRNIASDARGKSYGGFRMSTKLLELRKHMSTIPSEDKIIVFSFFKGFLDLVEAMLTHDMNIRCERFDGDVDQDKKSACLDNFRNNVSIRVLLATVQSGGVGLNIVEANWVFFADRWFNPQVHDQAFSRVWRIGQAKEAQEIYLDAQDTFDEVIRAMNETKERNAQEVLKIHGVEIGRAVGTMGLGYAEMSGSLLKGVERMVQNRQLDVGETALQQAKKESRCVSM